MAELDNGQPTGNISPLGRAVELDRSEIKSEGQRREERKSGFQ
jgi:hypothetical protein